MVLLHEKLNYSKDPEEVKHFPGRSNFFQGGGGQMLIAIETHISDFPRVSGPPIPPLDPHMIPLNKIPHYIFLLILACYLVLGLLLSIGYVVFV